MTMSSGQTCLHRVIARTCRRRVAVSEFGELVTYTKILMACQATRDPFVLFYYIKYIRKYK